MLSIFLYLGGNSTAKEWIEKGYVLNDQGKYLEAIECFNKALEIDPEYAEAWNNKGISLRKLGRYEEAIECYDKALEINPRLAESWHNKGIALNELGRYHEAQKCLRIAGMLKLGLNPNLH